MFPGGGVIWNIIPYETPVIPAKAGIQSVDSAFSKVCGVDSLTVMAIRRVV
jgi:hypothetical protein